VFNNRLTNSSLFMVKISEVTKIFLQNLLIKKERVFNFRLVGRGNLVLPSHFL